MQLSQDLEDYLLAISFYAAGLILPESRQQSQNLNLQLFPSSQVLTSLTQ
jgi:hypothetical protein